MSGFARYVWIVLLSGSLVACQVFRPPLNEVTVGLSEFLEPALAAGTSGTSHEIEVSHGTAACADPVFGPRRGQQPIISATIPIEWLESPDQLIPAMSDYWDNAGANVAVQTRKDREILFASTRRYSVSVLVNTESEEIGIQGSGPCVDDPAE